ncbi:class I SAM-dependent methyltransferase [Streptomyces sp. 7N604]|uniref:class I SAM-dependent methyltransferase n=1 Tax=Streptomyces sp. 7N604 TaxID=3457415 RepID=UPI003FD28E9D
MRFHVLEHVDDPVRFLTKAWSALTPGGWLALEVPNIASAAAQREGRSWPALQPDYHHWHFAPGSLQQLLHRCGFDVRRCETVLPRYYTRRSHWPRRSTVSRLVADWAACGSPRTTHPQLGDYLRVLAQRPTNRRRP